MLLALLTLRCIGFPSTKIALKGFVGHGYLYSGGGKSRIRFNFKAPASGPHQIRLAYLNHENRASNAQVTVLVSGRTKTVVVNMKEPAPLERDFVQLGEFDLIHGDAGYVELTSEGANGHIHADAIQILPISSR